jgi:phosphoribosyl-ATP pyrophosphohydrolase
MNPPGDFDAGTLARLADVIEARLGGDVGKSYVAQLAARGTDAILKKIGEEATETVMAVKDGIPERIVSEVADLWFHCVIALAVNGLRPEQVLAELERRAGTSGLQEKASRDEIPLRPAPFPQAGEGS